MFCLSGLAFLNSSQLRTYILMWEHKRKHLPYIICDMGFQKKKKQIVKKKIIYF